MNNKELDFHGTPREEKSVFRIASRQKTYVVDWSKVNNILDLIDLLKGLNMTFMASGEKNIFDGLIDRGLIVKSVKQLVDDYGSRIKEGNIIDLGWQNGWGKNEIDLHRQLFDRQEPGMYERSGEASDQTFRFTVIENGIRYTVVYKLDSGD